MGRLERLRGGRPGSEKAATQAQRRGLVGAAGSVACVPFGRELVDTGFWRRQRARTPLSVASTWEQGSHRVAPIPGLAYWRCSPLPTGRPLRQASAMYAANWTAHRKCRASASSARMGRGVRSWKPSQRLALARDARGVWAEHRGRRSCARRWTYRDRPRPIAEAGGGSAVMGSLVGSL
jgi:hypothetical protein